jgi:DNA-binding response OmpR family regulator
MPVISDRPHILIVEDDRLILSMLSMGLEKAGFSVVRASSGEEALQICSVERFDLILMDIRMPGISGIEAARRIRASVDVPVLFLSAYDDKETVDQAIGQGGMSYLVKPVEINQIVPAIRAVLARAYDLSKLKISENQLNQALDAERHTSIAIGIMMERRKLGAAKAYQLLRAQARPNRRKLAEVAKEIVTSTECLHTAEEK